MAKSNGAAKPAPFKPENLSKQEQESVVEYFLGAHPKYFVYEGVQNIKVDVYRMTMDGYPFTGFKESLTA